MRTRMYGGVGGAESRGFPLSRFMVRRVRHRGNLALSNWGSLIKLLDMENKDDARLEIVPETDAQDSPLPKSGSGVGKPAEPVDGDGGGAVNWDMRPGLADGTCTNGPSQPPARRLPPQ